MSRKGQKIKQKVQDIVRRCSEVGLPKLITGFGREAKKDQEEKGRIRRFIESWFHKEPEETKEQWSVGLDSIPDNPLFDRRSVDFHKYRAFDKK